jgi:hypothetical protein
MLACNDVRRLRHRSLILNIVGYAHVYVRAQEWLPISSGAFWKYTIAVQQLLYDS